MQSVYVNSFNIFDMVLSSRTYLSLVLGGIGLICITCLVMRWKMFAESSSVPQLGLQQQPTLYTEIGDHQVDHGKDAPAEIKALADPIASSGKGAAEQESGGARLADPATELLDINHATAEELEQLPGIGPVLAGRIVETRDRLGGFRNIEQLSEVEGIGEATLERLRPLLRVEPAG